MIIILNELKYFVFLQLRLELPGGDSSADPIILTMTTRCLNIITQLPYNKCCGSNLEPTLLFLLLAVIATLLIPALSPVLLLTSVVPIFLSI